MMLILKGEMKSHRSHPMLFCTTILACLRKNIPPMFWMMTTLQLALSPSLPFSYKTRHTHAHTHTYTHTAQDAKTSALDTHAGITCVILEDMDKNTLGLQCLWHGSARHQSNNEAISLWLCFCASRLPVYAMAGSSRYNHMLKPCALVDGDAAP
jgi:hypothetical protein